MRKPRSWLVAVAVALALVAVPPALAVSITPANGLDYILPKGDVYQLGPNGSYHLIPDVATANAMGLRWNQLSKVASVSPVGTSLPSVLPPAAQPPLRIAMPSTLANGKDYILPNAQLGADNSYHLIPDVATANAMRGTSSSASRA
jgi:hypothetical protein